ncbi:MAG: DUF3796 domain-containing protein [Paraclostridium sp.]|uniref:DUF3796 domain-containing protein n=1 Tax=Paraclostridium sp. TaxID=2023273 RepID=UPI003F2D3981
MGLLGFFGFVTKPNGDPNYFFFIFFSFFSWYWLAKLETKSSSKSFLVNLQKSTSFLLILPMLLSFFILFFLDRGTNPQIVLAFGSIGYSIIFILLPMIVCCLDAKK